jgi:prefoldin subunit 5
MAKVKFRKSYLSVMVLACVMFLLQAAVFNIPKTSACGMVTGTLDVEADVGSIHFRGEMAEFYILVSYSGKPMDADISAMLYYNGSLLANMTAFAEHVATGLYIIRYSIPMEALAGTYALVVNASHCTFRGTALKSFLLSQTLTNWNAWIIDIQGNMAIIQTDIGTIKVSLEAINATLISIDGRIATIETDLGIIKTDISNIELRLTSIEGNIAIINSAIGEIQISLSQINAKLTSLNGTVATIQTDIGIIKVTLEDLRLNVTNIQGNIANINTTLGNIEGTLVSIQGDIATIKTDIGNITVSLPSTEITTLGIPIAAILAGIGAAGSSISVALLLRKRKTSNH